MARSDVVVLGAGIVGVSIALQLAKRGLAVSLVDRRGPGEETSYGNAGVIEGNTIFPPAFPPTIGAILRVALKRAPEANYHVSFLPWVAPWLLAFRANSSLPRLLEFARLTRPLYARALPEHEILLEESRAARFLRKAGWLKIYRSEQSYKAVTVELGVARDCGVPFVELDPDGARELEPSLAPIFRYAVHWPNAANLSDPLAVTRAYAARFAELGGRFEQADARTLQRVGNRWRVATGGAPVEAEHAVVALGPWAPDVLEPLGIRLPLGIKRGYHRHFRPAGNALLGRPVGDIDNGYALAPMDQGIRITTGAEFADRDARPTPVQLDRLMPHAKALFPLGEPVEPVPWMGSRPCFADSRPVIGPAPKHSGLWLAFGHAHWGLTLGPATGRLVAEMITKSEPFCDPTPYSAERFAR